MWDTTNLILANANHGSWYSDHMDWSWMSGMHGSFWPLMIILIAAILLVAFYLGTRDDRPHETATASAVRRRPTAARDILDERYARGEIDRGEYLESKREL
jgi:putative membrane protein